MYFPSEKEFLSVCQKGNLIPVYKEVLGDLDTPVSAYFKIAKNARYSILLESVEGEEKVARFSFLAKDPELIFESKGNAVKITRYVHGKAKREHHSVQETPIAFIRDILRQYKFVNIDG